MPEPIRVLLVLSPMLFRRSLAAMLNKRRRLVVVGEAGTGSEALYDARRADPDVVVVDPEVPEGGPLLLTEVCRALPQCAVLVLTASREDGAMRRALEAGARGYLDTQCGIDDVLRAIERVHAGELVVAPADAETALRDLVGGSTAGDGSAGLTPRQLEVLRLVAQGRTNQEIAHRLCITEHTVKAHMAKLLTALQLDNRVQLAAYAVEHGLADTVRAALAG